MSVILKKENGVVKEVEATKENIKDIRQIGKKDDPRIHLCWENCANALAGKCEKVTEREKHSISDYDFITDGIQLFDDNGELDTFIVTKCNNYVKTNQKKKNQEEIQRLKRLREGLRTSYFDTETVEEAYLLQDELLRSTSENKVLLNPRGSKPTHIELARMRNKAHKK